MRDLNPLQFVPIGKAVMEMSDKLEPWMRSWWGDTLTSKETSDLFEEEKIVKNLCTMLF